MTLTIAIIVNAVLMAGIVAVVARAIHLPFRVERGVRRLERAVHLSGERDELERAA